jgi:hypothetical protein
MEYHKIHSLYKRELTEVDRETGETRFKDKGKSGNPLIIGDYACPEFENIKYWIVDEKMDGTNIRIFWEWVPLDHGPRVQFAGRTSRALIPEPLLRYLEETFTVEKLMDRQPIKEGDCMCFYGEGIGPKIQSGGYYSTTPQFVLFDIRIKDWWLKKEDVNNIATSLGINHAPLIRCIADNLRPVIRWTTEDIIEFVKSKPLSLFAMANTGEKRVMEGIIARAEPQVLFRKDKNPVLFKLKCKDFP